MTNRAIDRIRKRLDIIERMLDAGTDVYPPLCDCVTKNRTSKVHLQSCPYRMMRDLVRELRTRL